MFKRSNAGSKPDTAKPVTAPNTADAKAIAAGKQAYEARRAAKAGVSLDRWMADKQKRAQAELEAARRASPRSPAPKPGLLKRLLDRAHKPF